MTVHVNARVGGTLGNIIVVTRKEGHGMVDVDIPGTILARNDHLNQKRKHFGLGGPLPTLTHPPRAQRDPVTVAAAHTQEP